MPRGSRTLREIRLSTEHGGQGATSPRDPAEGTQRRLNDCSQGCEDLGTPVGGGNDLRCKELGDQPQPYGGRDEGLEMETRQPCPMRFPKSAAATRHRFRNLEQ